MIQIVVAQISVNIVTKRFMNEDTKCSSFAIISYLVYNVIVCKLIKITIITSPCFRKTNNAKSEV